MGGKIFGFVLVLPLTYVLLIDGRTVRQTIDLGDDDRKVVTSVGFPDECCYFGIYTVQYNGGFQGRHIRLEFTDLDVPEMTIIQFVNGDYESYNDQVLTSNGALRRKIFDFPGPVLKIVFKPSIIEPVGSHAGFRAIVWMTRSNSPSENFWPISERCPLAGNVEQGSILQIQSDRALLHVGSSRDLEATPMYDCIWVIKRPKESKGNNADDFKPNVYLSILEMDIPVHFIKNTRLQINRGKSSQGQELLRLDGSDMRNVNRKAEAVSFSDSEALYVRFRMPYFAPNHYEPYTIRFGFGIHTLLDDEMALPADSGCYFGDVEGLACKTEGWCIPESYGCNGVVNCPSMEDETLHNCEELKRRRTEITLDQTPAISTIPTVGPDVDMGDEGQPRNDKISCSYWQKKCYNSKLDKYDCRSKYEPCPDSPCPGTDAFCKDGRCVIADFYCDFLLVCGYMESLETCDGECMSIVEHCPSKPCPEGIEFKCQNGKRCIPEDWVCDKKEDCSYGEDEWNCPAESLTGLIVAVILVFVLLLIGIIAIAVFFCKYSNRRCCGDGAILNRGPQSAARPVNPSAPYSAMQAAPKSKEAAQHDASASQNAGQEPKKPRNKEPSTSSEARVYIPGNSGGGGSGGLGGDLPDRVEYWSSSSFMPIQ